MNMPRNWQDAETLEGYDFEDKANLVGEPFLITDVEFYTNDKGVAMVNVDAEKADGAQFRFNDSSTGVYAQLREHLGKRVGDIEDGTVFPMRLVVPKGLRVSTYGLDKQNNIVDVNDTRAVKKPRTYYLTTGGKPAAPTAPEKPAKRPARPAKSSAPTKTKRDGERGSTAVTDTNE